MRTDILAVHIAFDRSDTLSWAALEDQVGTSGSNCDQGELLVLIWRGCSRARASQIINAALSNKGVFYAICQAMEVGAVSQEAPSEKTPALRLVEWLCLQIRKIH